VRISAHEFPPTNGPATYDRPAVKQAVHDFARQNGVSVGIFAGSNTWFLAKQAGAGGAMGMR